MSEWIFTIIGWLFSHTAATQAPYKSDFCILDPL